MAIRLANGLNLDQGAVAEETADAEWYVGTRGGMMDHATMVFAESEKMLQLTFRPFTAKPLDASGRLGSCKFVTIFTHPSDKGTSTKLAFNARALAARDLIPDMLASLGHSPTDPLAEVPIEQIPEVVNVSEISNQMMKRYPALHTRGDWDLRARAWLEFAVSEYGRSWEVVEAMAEGTDSVGQLGQCMSRAWEDAGELYGIRTSQMDKIADLCKQCDGVLGIKVMGAGFGGNILILIEENHVDDLHNLLQNNSELFSRSVDDSLIVHGLGSGVSILTGPEGDMNWSPLWHDEEV